MGELMGLTVGVISTSHIPLVGSRFPITEVTPSLMTLA